MVTAPPKPRSSGSSKPLAHRITQQIADEPFEIIEKAGEQVVGQKTEEIQEQIKDRQAPQESALERRKHAVLQALKTELQEIDELAKKRQGEMQARWQEQERVKEQRWEQIKETQKKSLLEPVAKIKRWIWGGMQKLALKRKQRQVEMAKTPSN